MSSQRKMVGKRHAIVPNKDDILLGRKANAFHHLGNRRYRHIIAMNLHRYKSCKDRLGKMVLAKEVTEAILDNGRVRFLRCDKDNEWTEVPFQTAKEKISHALRDGVSRSILPPSRPVDNQQQNTTTTLPQPPKTITQSLVSASKSKSGSGSTPIPAASSGVNLPPSRLIGKQQKMVPYPPTAKKPSLTPMLPHLLASKSNLDPAPPYAVALHSGLLAIEKSEKRRAELQRTKKRCVPQNLHALSMKPTFKEEEENLKRLRPSVPSRVASTITHAKRPTHFPPEIPTKPTAQIPLKKSVSSTNVQENVHSPVRSQKVALGLSAYELLNSKAASKETAERKLVDNALSEYKKKESSF